MLLIPVNYIIGVNTGKNSLSRHSYGYCVLTTKLQCNYEVGHAHYRLLQCTQGMAMCNYNHSKGVIVATCEVSRIYEIIKDL